MIKLFISTLLFVLLACIVKSQYILTSLYSQSDCASGLVGSYTGTVGPCYTFDSNGGSYGSYKYISMGSLYIYHYSGSDCTGGLEGFTNFLPSDGACTSWDGYYLKRQTISSPILPEPGYVYYEKYPGNCGDSANNVRQSVVKVGSCYYADDLYHVVNGISGSNTSVTLNYGQLINDGCSSTTTNFLKSSCDTRYKIGNAFVASAINLVFPPVSNITVNTINIPTISTNSGVEGFSFSIAYWDGIVWKTVGTCQPGGCTVTVLAGISTKLRATIIATSANGNPATNYCDSPPIQMVPIPLVTSASLVPNSRSFVNMSIIFTSDAQANATDVTTYKIYIGTTPLNPQPLCYPNVVCVVGAGLPPLNYIIDVAAVTKGFESPFQRVFASIYQKVNNVQITSGKFTDRTTYAITFSSDGGFVPDPTHYTVLLDNQPYIPCQNITATSCSISGMPEGNRTIQVVADNGSQDSSSITYAYVWDLLHSVNIQVTLLTTKLINTSYSSAGGNSSLTYYTVSLNGTVKCSNVQYNTCPILSLVDDTNYNVTVVASNNGVSVSNSQIIKTLKQINSPTIIVDNIRTSSCKLNYYVLDGLPDDTTYTVKINNNTMNNCKTNSCQIVSLNDNTTYTAEVTFKNDGATVIKSISFTTYPNPSKPTIKIQQTLNGLSITFDSNYGVPNESTYTVSIDGVTPLICTNLTTKQCTFNNWVPGSIDMPINHQFIVNVTVQNDNVYNSNLSNYTSFDEPQLSTISSSTSLESFNITYSVKKGGAPGYSYFNVFISYLDYELLPICLNQTENNSTGNTCGINGLVADVNYTVTVELKNTYFGDRSYNSTVLNTTLPDPQTNQCSTSNCSNNGVCLYGVCQCNSGWDGPQCDISTFIRNASKTLTVSADVPTYHVVINDISYDLTVKSLVEKDEQGNTVTSLDLIDQVTWSKVNGSETTQNATINSQTFTMTNTTSIVGGLQVVFSSSTNSTSDNENGWVMFAGQYVNYKIGNTIVKYRVSIDHWSFKSINNSLEVSVIVTHPTDSCGVQSNSSASLFNTTAEMATLVIGSGNVIYARIHNAVLLDYIPKRIHHTHKDSVNFTSSIITSVLPSFTKQAVIDPTFNLLLATNSTGFPTIPTRQCITDHQPSSNNNWKIIVGVVVGVGGAAIAGASIFFLSKKYLHGSRVVDSRRIELNAIN